MTTKLLTWETECRPHIRYLNTSGDVALCVLWNKLDDTISQLGEIPPRLAMAGNLRTPLGISWFLRGLWLHPNIGTIVIWGKDYTGTGKAVQNIWENGLTKDNQIQLDHWQIDRNMDSDAMDALNCDTRLVNMIGTPIESLREMLSTVGRKSTCRAYREFAPMIVNVPDTLPFYGSGIGITVSSPCEAWIKVLNAVMKYGTIKGTRKEEILRHLFHVSVTMPVVDYIYPERIFDISRQEADDYYEFFIQAEPPDAGIDYRYGNRMQNWRGHNQLNEVVERLRKSPDTKRASISLLDATDLSTLEDAPCYIAATYSITDGKLNSSHVFRSHDMYSGWPLNIFSILRLQCSIANKIGIKVGNATFTSQNAQIYQRNWSEAQERIDKYMDAMSCYYGTGYDFKPDVCGNFHFSIDEDQQVVVRLTDASGESIVWEYSHVDPLTVAHMIVEMMPVLDNHHLVYIAIELGKVAIALRDGTEYVQG
jgi:thymidylate synthase